MKTDLLTTYDKQQLIDCRKVLEGKIVRAEYEMNQHNDESLVIMNIKEINRT